MRALWTGAAAAAALAFPALASRAALSTMRMPLNYNEGWNAYHALSVAQGRALYPPADALLPNNYPPLSFHLVAGVGRRRPEDGRDGVRARHAATVAQVIRDG